MAEWMFFIAALFVLLVFALPWVLSLGVFGRTAPEERPHEERETVQMREYRVDVRGDREDKDIESVEVLAAGVWFRRPIIKVMGCSRWGDTGAVLTGWELIALGDVRAVAYCQKAYVDWRAVNG